jgi:hypothetical protein
MNPLPKQRFGRLEMLCSAAALALILGSYVDLWPFSLPIALVLLALLYGVLWDLRSLNRSKHPAQHNSRQSYAEQTDRTCR